MLKSQHGTVYNIKFVEINIMQTNKIKVTKSLLISIIVIALTACNGGGTGSSSSSGISNAAVTDFSNQAQIAAATGAACFNISAPSTTLGAWWTSGTFNITNTCSSNQSVNGTQVNIASANYGLTASSFSLNSINGLYFGPPAWWAQSTGVFASASANGVQTATLTIGTAGNITGYIQPGAAVTVSFGYNPGGKIPGSFSYTINGSTPVQPGNVALSVDTTALKTVCTGATTCNIPLILSGQNGTFSQTVMTVTNANAGSALTANLTSLNPGSYTLAALNSALPSRTTFTAAPINVVANTTVNASGIFAVAPITTGTISYSVSKPSGISLASNSLTINLLNSIGSIAATQDSAFAVLSNFSNVSAGNYSLTSLGFADAQTGVYAAPLNKAVTVAAGVTNNLGSLSMSAPNTTVVPMSIVVTGLASGESATVTLTDSMNYKFNTFSIKAGTNDVKLLNGDNVVFNISANSKYNQINPTAVTVSSGNVVNVSFTQPQPGSGKIVGYFETWQATGTWESATYSIATVPSYVNTMPLAFAKPDSVYTAGSFNFAGAGLGIAASPQVAVGAIKLARAKGQKVLLSVGGATYPNFAALNVPAIMALVKDLGVDGVDLDYEADTNGCTNLNTASLSCPTDTQLISVITQLRAGLDAIRPGMTLSAAVWSIGAYGTTTFPTTTYLPGGSKSALWVNPLKQVGNKLDEIYIMSYDAGNASSTGYNPISAFKAYKAIYTGPIYLGVEVPPEAWGGNVTTPAQAQSLATQVSQLGGAGIMLWALQVQGLGYTSNSFLQPICLMYNANNSTLCSQMIPQN